MTTAHRDKWIEAPWAKVSVAPVRKQAASSERLSEMIEQVAETARRMFSASGSSVLLIAEEGGDLIFKVATGKAGKRLKGMQISKLRGTASWVVRHGVPLIVNNVGEDWRFDRIVDILTGFTTRSVMCAPLVDHGKVIGVIEVVNKLDGTNFSENDLESLASMAHAAVLPIIMLATKKEAVSGNHS